MKDKITKVVKNAFNFEQIDTDLTVWFLFEGKEYELAQFNISFGQAIDHKGQPQDEVRGGRILLTLSEAVPDNIYKWAMTSCARNGEVTFRSKTTSAPMKVNFMNGYCVNFNRTVGEGGLETTLVITPEEILMNGISFDNRWVE